MEPVFFLALSLVSAISTSFSQKESKTFIFVHAQWHGAWCWDKLVPIMEGRGYKSISFDLPGYGRDTTPVETVTLADCVDKVVAIAKQQPGKVILVGHSSSGVVVAQASEVLGKDKVASLVFLDAFLPNDGESVFGLVEKYATEGTTLAKTLQVSPDQKTVSLDIEKVGELLYHDCSPEDLDYAKSHLRPSPLAILATPVRLTAANYGAIPKYYILCTMAKDMDKTALAKNVECKKIYMLPSSHSPFLSMPDRLSEILEEIY